MSSDENLPPSVADDPPQPNTTNPPVDSPSLGREHFDVDQFAEEDADFQPQSSPEQPNLPTSADHGRVPPPSRTLPAYNTFGMMNNALPKLEGHDDELFGTHGGSFTSAFGSAYAGQHNLPPQSVAAAAPGAQAQGLSQLPASFFHPGSNPFATHLSTFSEGIGYQYQNHNDRTSPYPSLPSFNQAVNTGIGGFPTTQADPIGSLIGSQGLQYARQGNAPAMQQPQTGYQPADAGPDVLDYDYFNDGEDDGADGDDSLDGGAGDDDDNTPVPPNRRSQGLHDYREVRNRKKLIRRSSDPVHYAGIPGLGQPTVDITGNYRRLPSGQSGRGLLGIFPGIDQQPRTRYRIRIERGRSGKDAHNQYPGADQPIPAGLTLEDICARYPNHVWGTGLRLFMHEQMCAEAIWKATPADARHDGFKARPHNYLQQAIGREMDKIQEEITGKARTKPSRAKDDKDGDGKPANKKRKREDSEDKSPPPARPSTGWFHQPFHRGVMPSAPGPAFTAPPAAARPASFQPPCSPPEDYRAGAERDQSELDELITWEMQAQRRLLRQIMSLRDPVTATWTEQQWNHQLESSLRQRIRSHLDSMTQRAGLVQIPILSSNPITMHVWMLQNRGQVRMPKGEHTVNRGIALLARSRYVWVLRDSNRTLKWQLAQYQAQAQAAQGGQQG